MDLGDHLDSDDIGYCQEVIAIEEDLDTSTQDIKSLRSEFYCKICNMSFVKKYHYNTHMRTHTTKKQYQCETCLKSFIQKCDLTTHTRIHTGEKPFVCTVSSCGKGFIQKGDLTKHMRVHTGEKPFVCDICDRGFIQNGDLTKHYRTHTGEKPFVCNLCLSSYIQKSDLTKHMRRHDNESPLPKKKRAINRSPPPTAITCNVCDIVFTKEKDLINHLQQHKNQRKNETVYLCNSYPEYKNEKGINKRNERKSLKEHRDVRKPIKSHKKGKIKEEIPECLVLIDEPGDDSRPIKILNKIYGNSVES